ncbi:hypothetical protein PR202_gb16187 [Eleusine coracana subsp. coracana]|uniref:Uncharacterized protein n=1 Tax=Eleusine coracana subsp. coracana TaxID=191504 RepID=A0AAV5EXI5_ELECO|nr:hypothetical protein PR202_gb16187 [Eleusine coracana subsp. coracana]
MRPSAAGKGSLGRNWPRRATACGHKAQPGRGPQPAWLRRQARPARARVRARAWFSGGAAAVGRQGYGEGLRWRRQRQGPVAKTQLAELAGKAARGRGETRSGGDRGSRRH